MFVRIVKMSFEPTKVDEFLNLFDAKKDLIRNFKGCEFLELYRDKQHDNIFFSYSYWENEECLHNYRHSDFFISVWTEIKKSFNNKPEAWSVDKMVSLP